MQKPWRRLEVKTCPECQAKLTEPDSVVVERQQGGKDEHSLVQKTRLDQEGWVWIEADEPESAVVKLVFCDECWLPLDPYEAPEDEQVYHADQAVS